MQTSRLAGSVVVGSLAASTLHAAILTPASLTAGDKFNLVFISNRTTSAVDSNPATYDDLIVAEAASAGLDTYDGSPVTWRTLASFVAGPTAISRFNPASGVFGLDGSKVADNGADLWDGSLQNPIDIASDGSTVLGALVWTGSTSDGNAASFVNSKALGGTEVTNWGVSDATARNWIEGGTEASTGENRLYAFSNELTVPVPEPSGAAMLAAATATAVLLRRKHSSSATS